MSSRSADKTAIVQKQQRQLQQQHADSIWSIEGIVDGPKIEVVGGKKRKMYKVRWSETFELANNIPNEMIELYEKRGKKQIKILGPLVSQKESGSGDPKPNGMMPLQKKTRFAVEIGDEVKFIAYSQVKSMYKEELLDYFEERAKIEE